MKSHSQPRPCGERGPFWQSRLHLLAVAFLGLATAGLAGCTPKVGDHCILNTDCGTSGNLVCDTSLPNGYCTQFNCTPDVCQNEAACVAFGPQVPGCPYDDYHSPARTARTFCLAQCHSDSDCRTSEGYFCRDPRQPPYNAAIIDDDQAQLVCIPAVTSSLLSLPTVEGGVGGVAEGSVCEVTGPQYDASFWFPEQDSAGDVSSEGVGPSVGDGSGGALESGMDVGADVSLDVSADAPPQAAADSGGEEGGGGEGGAADAGMADAADGG